MKLNLEKEAKISKGYFSDSGIDLYPIDKGEISKDTYESILDIIYLLEEK